MENNQGMLYLCATPIGNLEDITFRVLNTLKNVDLIAAEDTRHSIKLLNHFDIHTPMTSYHEYNKVEKARQLVKTMLDGKTIALITDAGTPGISDPGEELVKQCIEAGVEVSALPGAAACITALIQSGLPTRRFCFEAFLPANKKEREQVLSQLANETRTIVMYEAPHHLEKTLKQLADTLGSERKITLCRELTKKYEEKSVTTLGQAIQNLEVNPARGEYVLVIEGKSFESIEKEQQEQFETMTIEEHMEKYLSSGMDKKSAMKQVAKDRGISKREVYQQLINE